tara:strand:- start:952 stop:1725 length:774 start_codon:yes stop_codon:yes gene_type:complete
VPSEGFETANLTVTVGNTNILDHVSLRANSGELTAIIGPNGAGKSTLMKCLSGDYVPTDGYVRLFGHLISDLSPASQAQLRAVMTQSTHVPFDFLVSEVLDMGLLKQSGEVSSRMTCIVRECRIEHLLERRLNSLSGGEQQRVHFARVLIQASSVDDSGAGFLLLDEPTSSLDLAHELRTLALISSYVKEGFGALVVLHDLNLAARFADKVVLLHNGRIVSQGARDVVLTTDILSACYETPVTVEYHETRDHMIVLT